MIKKTYVGMVNFHGAQWARIAGSDVSKMTGVKGVNKLVLEEVKGLQGTLDFRGIKTIEFINTNVSDVKIIQCDANCKIDGLKGENKLSGLIIYEHAGPINPATKLIKDYMYNNQTR